MTIYLTPSIVNTSSLKTQYYSQIQTIYTLPIDTIRHAYRYYKSLFSEYRFELGLLKLPTDNFIAFIARPQTETSSYGLASFGYPLYNYHFLFNDHYQPVLLAAAVEYGTLKRFQILAKDNHTLELERF